MLNLVLRVPALRHNSPLTMNLKNNLFAMMEELKTALQEGGETQMDNENIILEGEEQEIVDPVTEPETEFKKKPEDEEDKKEEGKSS